MPRKMSGIAISVIEASSVASRIASVVFERTTHLYLSSGAIELPFPLAEAADTMYSYSTGILCSSPAYLRYGLTHVRADRDRHRPPCRRPARRHRPTDPS